MYYTILRFKRELLEKIYKWMMIVYAGIAITIIIVGICIN